MPLSGGQTFAGYRIVRQLGSGGMGEVYLAEHPRLPRRDAIKVLPADVSADPNYRARFNREADLASKLWHLSQWSFSSSPKIGLATARIGDD
jgi:serine/threonine protein kinase